MDNEDKEVVEAIIASLVKAINERLENAAQQVEESGFHSKGSAEIVRSYKVDAAQINVVRE